MFNIHVRRWQAALVILLAAAAIVFFALLFVHSRTAASVTSPQAPVVKTTDSQPAQENTKPAPTILPLAAVTQAGGQAVVAQPLLSQSIDSSKGTSNIVYYRNKVAVLTYHHLDPSESSITISPDRFQSHLDALKEHGFHVISMNDFILFLQKKGTVPPNAVVLTFDDGYESVYKYAYPIMKSRGDSATTFLIVSYVDDGKVHQPSILNWNEITEMHRDGFDFYSHSYNSHDSVFDAKGKELSQLVVKLPLHGGKQTETDAQYRERIRSDLTKADDILNSKLGNSINLLCFPHGQYNSALVKVANEAGISYMFTGKEGLNAPGDTLLKRINAGSPYMSKELLIKRLSKLK